MGRLNIPAIPPSMPRRGNAFTRWLGRLILLLTGWRIVGVVPDVSRAVLIVAPHSSNWDGLYGGATALALGIDPKWMGKNSLFKGPLGPLMRWLGGTAIDRKHANGMVGQCVERFGNNEALWMVITPEGTRKQVDRWKSGFYHVAHGARVPIITAYFDYPSRTIGFGPITQPSGDVDADIAQLREWYSQWEGKGGMRAA